MPSHLTRHVFRRLLANETIVHRGCLRRRAYSCAASHTSLTNGQYARHVVRTAGRPSWEQRRAFFNFGMFRKAKRDTKGADMDPGLEKMMEFEKLVRLKARLPSRQEVAKAFTDFFEAKSKVRQAVEDNQVKLALQSYRYCTVPESGESVSFAQHRPMLSDETLGTAALVLENTAQRTTSDHVELSKEIYERLKTASERLDAYGTRTYARNLCMLGMATGARDLVLSFEQRRKSSLTWISGSSLEDSGSVRISDDPDTPLRASLKLRLGHHRQLWAVILKFWAENGNDEEVHRTLQIIRDRNLQDGLIVPATMLQYSLQRDDVDGVKHWWRAFHGILVPRDGQWSAASQELIGQIVGQTLHWCIASHQLDVGHGFVRNLMQPIPPKLVWDAIFVWAAGTGKGVDEIGRMIDVMERTNKTIEREEHWRMADVATINALVEYATSKDDPYMAERFIALGRDHGIEPDAKTYVLQMAYRLRVNDIDGALIAYKNLQTMDLSTDEDIPVVNQLIVALCTSRRHDFDTVMNVAADLSDRRARFEPLTVATLSLLHMDRDEIHDVIDLLNTHAFHYSSTERTVVRDMIVAYCLDSNTPVARSWDAYSIIRNVFDELSREPRTQLMSSFFARDRPDMAVHVFNHMRGHSRADTMPTTDTYVTAFLGAAKRRDLESLEVLHNQLKLDFNITLTTHIRNALLIAYTSCGRPRKALQFWDDIVASREGPSYNSIHIALRACERSPFGDLKAQEIWAKLGKMNVELDTTMWASYVAALAGNGDVENAIRVLAEAERKGEVDVDAFVLGSLFMGTPGMDKQRGVEAWAQGKYPAQWKELLGMGVEEAEDGMRAFGIDRSVTP